MNNIANIKGKGAYQNNKLPIYVTVCHMKVLVHIYNSAVCCYFIT